jgi:hypothetical protein
MKKKADLSAALKSAARSSSKTAAMTTAPSREGKRAITGFFDPAVSKQLRTIAVNRDSTVQDLLGEALNDLFEKYKHARLA